MTQLQGSRRTSDELEQRCQNLGQKVDDKEYEKRSLQRELSVLMSRHQDLVGRHQDLMSRHQDLQEELARMMAERNKEEADHRQEKEDLMERLRDAAREKHELEIRLEQVHTMYDFTIYHIVGIFAGENFCEFLKVGFPQLKLL